MLWGLGALLFLAIALGALLARPRGENAPFVPQDVNAVLETLPSNKANPRSLALKSLRLQLEARPNDLELATRLARLNIEEGRFRSDPRYLGYAQAALKPWWSEPTPPAAVGLLRATIRQSLHDFDGALADLAQVVKATPDDPQAWLTRSVIEAVQGRYAEAKRSCMPLTALSTSLVVTVCLANVQGLEGQAKAAYQHLHAALEESQALTRSEEVWAVSTLGELAVRAGNPAEAENLFRRALALEPADAYVLGAFADLLLDLHRPGEVVDYLEQQRHSDALLLRLAIAEARTGGARAREDRATLRSRFEASRARGDVVHRREESRFELELEGNAPRALELAQANWAVQREPADARVLLEAAWENRRPEAAAQVLAFVAQSHLEDPRIVELAQQLGEKR